jgi:hypothetical protein
MPDPDRPEAFLASINERLELALDADTTAADRDAIARQVAADVGPLTDAQLEKLQGLVTDAADQQLEFIAEAGELIARSAGQLRGLAGDAPAADVSQTIDALPTLGENVRGMAARAASYFAVCAAFERQ